jgi:elongation factor P--beta-lysine ligase
VVTIENFITSHQKIGFDTNVLIAHIEGDKDYSSLATEVFRACVRHNKEMWLSVISIPETLVKPLLKRSSNLNRCCLRAHSHLLRSGRQLPVWRLRLPLSIELSLLTHWSLLRY